MLVKSQLSKLAIIASLIAFIYIFYYLFFNPSLPNIYFAGKKISTDRQDKTQKLISELFSDFEKKPVILNIKDEQVLITKSDIGLSFDSQKTTEKILKIGKSGNLLKDLENKLRLLIFKQHVKPVYYVDFWKLSRTLDQKIGPWENPAQNSTVVFANDTPQILEERAGEIINKSHLYNNIYLEFDFLNPDPITVEMIAETPSIKTWQAKKALDRVISLQNQKVVLTFEGNSWKLEKENLLANLRFYPPEQKENIIAQFRTGGSPITLQWTSLQNQQRDLDVAIDEGHLELFVKNIAKQVDRIKIDATLTFEEEQVKNFVPARDGRELNKEETKKLIQEKISINNRGEEREIKIALPVEIKTAKIANEEINSLGIKELLGKGESFFSGSIANRISNLSLAASRISGTIVAPQEVFSFNETAGEVSQSTGYKKAYVISEGKTVLDDGGGVCQVSTTIFRAALNAGLPIVSRTAHAYRVAYYEQGSFKAGFDATVWAPAVDFKFKNDTQHHILVQAVVDPSRSKIEVDIYGTRDRREVKISNPQILNQTPPLPEKYQDDPTLKKGIVKQIDFAASGATVIFDRQVEKMGELVINESFKSSYRPWQAVYLVGTGD